MKRLCSSKYKWLCMSSKYLPKLNNTLYMGLYCIVYQQKGVPCSHRAALCYTVTQDIPELGRFTLWKSAANSVRKRTIYLSMHKPRDFFWVCNVLLYAVHDLCFVFLTKISFGLAMLLILFSFFSLNFARFMLTYYSFVSMFLA